jgi:hypothetical protein
MEWVKAQLRRSGGQQSSKPPPNFEGKVLYENLLHSLGLL